MDILHRAVINCPPPEHMLTKGAVGAHQGRGAVEVAVVVEVEDLQAPIRTDKLEELIIRLQSFGSDYSVLNQIITCELIQTA